MSETVSPQPEQVGSVWSIVGGHYRPPTMPTSRAEAKKLAEQKTWLSQEVALINDLVGNFTTDEIKQRYVAYQLVSLAAQLVNPELFGVNQELGENIHRQVAAAAKATDYMPEAQLAQLVNQAITKGLANPPISQAVEFISSMGEFSDAQRLRCGALISRIYLDESANSQPDSGNIV